MKICYDCKYLCGRTSVETRAPFCRAPESNPEIDVIYGHPKYESARSMRADRDWCGPDAVWFVPKEQPKRRSWWRILG